MLSIALMAKPMAVTLPFVLLLLDLWPLGRLGEAGERGLPRSSLVIEKLPLLVLAAIVSAITFIVQNRAAAVVPLTVSPFADRVANAVVAQLPHDADGPGVEIDVAPLHPM
jgi:hypothetical protein